MITPAFPTPASSSPFYTGHNRRRAMHVARQQEDQIGQAVLTLDIYGQIIAGSLGAAHLLGMRPQNLTGHTAAAFLSPLPLHHSTPGYNLAYATFHAYGHQHQRLTAHTADHGPREVDVAITVVTWRGARALRLTLKPQPAPSSGQ